MNIHFIYAMSSTLPAEFEQTWKDLFPEDTLLDVTNRQKGDGRMPQRHAQVFLLEHSLGIQDAHEKKGKVFASLGLGFDVDTGVAREIELKEEKVIPLPPAVFGPSSREKPKTYERKGVRHIG